MKTLFIFSCIILALTTSCKLVYSTSEVQQNLKQTADQFSKNTTKIRKEYQLFTAEYNSFQCETTKSPFMEADRQLSHLNNSIKELESINSSVQKEYLDFLNYTKGKKELVSGTEEWEKIKSTKKHYKSSISAYEEKSELLQKETAVFQSFVSTKVSPSLQKCDIVSYTKKAKEELIEAEKNAKNAVASIQNMDIQVQLFILNNKNSQPDLCGIIQREWSIVKEQELAISKIIIKLSAKIGGFEEATKGKVVLVSCAPDWTIVENFEKELKESQSEVNQINATINQQISAMNAMINPIKKG